MVMVMVMVMVIVMVNGRSGSFLSLSYQQHQKHQKHQNKLFIHSLVCPSVVPILTLLSRLEQDQLSDQSRDQSSDHLMDQFEQRICVSVGCFLSSPALQVRHLAGRSLN